MQQAAILDKVDGVMGVMGVMGAAIQEAAEVPALTHREAGRLASVELERFLALVESLGEDDWSKPTACTLWNVKQMVAHAAGACAGWAGWREFKRQYSPLAHRPYRKAGMSQLDTINHIQVTDRAGASPAAIIAELRRVGPRAIATRQKLPGPLRAIRVPLPVLGFVRIDYLTDLIYPRDMWMHRLDLCWATNREMVQTPEHDGRIVALVMRDLAASLRSKLGEASVVYTLTGTAGGSWRLGSKSRSTAGIQMDVLDFNGLASGRITAREAQAGSIVQLTGDTALALKALENTSVPY